MSPYLKMEASYAEVLKTGVVHCASSKTDGGSFFAPSPIASSEENNNADTTIILSLSTTASGFTDLSTTPDNVNDSLDQTAIEFSTNGSVLSPVLLPMDCENKSESIFLDQQPVDDAKHISDNTSYVAALLFDSNTPKIEKMEETLFSLLRRDDDILMIPAVSQQESLSTTVTMIQEKPIYEMDICSSLLSHKKVKMYQSADSIQEESSSYCDIIPTVNLNSVERDHSRLAEEEVLKSVDHHDSLPLQSSSGMMRTRKQVIYISSIDTII